MKIEDIKKEIIDHVKKNIIATFSFIFLLFGGLIFYIYYLDIKYLPDLNFINSVQLLVFASFTGILWVLSTIAMLIFPGLFWQKKKKKNEIIANVWSNRLLRIILIFIIPMLCVYLSFYIYIVDQSKFNIIKYQWTIFFNLLFILLLYVWGLLKHKTQQIAWKRFLIDYGKCMGLAYYGSFISILPIVLLALVFLDNYKEDKKSFAIGCLLLTIYVVFSNVIIIVKPENVNSINWFSRVGLISFLFITVFTNTTSTFPKAIMKTYKLGNIEASSIIVDKEGCNTINKLMKFYKVKDPSNKDKLLHFTIENDSCFIPNVHILSKLGKEAYIEFDEISIKIKNKEYKNKTMRFVIPSSSIITYNLIR